MDSIRSIKDFKTTKLADHFKLNSSPVHIKYDVLFDALIILFVSPETETIVYYIDESVGLLYQPDNLEIVGLQIEDFEYTFISKYEGVKKVWRLSDSDSLKDLEDVGDLILVVEKREKEVAKEVFKSTEPLLFASGLVLPST